MNDENSTAENLGGSITTSDSTVQLPVEGNHFSIYVVGASTTPDTETYNFYNNTELVSKQIVKVGDTLVEPATPASVSGKAFTGWFAEGSTEKFSHFGTVANVTKDSIINLYANFADGFHVFYMDSDNRVIETRVVKTNTAINVTDLTLSVGTTPTQALVGWDIKQNSDTALELLTMNQADVTLYPVIKNADWVTYNTNGGTTIDPEYYLSGTITKAPAQPTREGYEFGGWYSDASFAHSFSFGYVLDGNTTIYAKWNAKTVDYTIVYWLENANDSNYSYKEQESATGKVGDEAIYDVTHSYDHFTLNTNKTDAEKNKVTISADGTAIKNVYFSRNTYTLALKTYQWVETGNYSGEYQWVTVYSYSGIKYGQDTEKWWTEGTSKNPSYLWYTSKDENAKEFYTAAPVMDEKVSTSMTNEGIVAYGRTASGNSTIHYYERGTNNKVRDDFSVGDLGWNFTNVDFVSIDGFITYPMDENYYSEPYYGTDYYIYYDRQNYNIKFYTNGGVAVNDINNIPYQSNIASYSPSAYAAGKTTKTVNKQTYYFAGWYDNEACAGSPYDFTGKTMPANNLILYAKWTTNKYTVTFNTNGGTPAISSITDIIYGTTIEEPTTTLTKEGYKFAGWKNGSNAFSFTTPITSDITLTASWISTSKYNITYKNGDTEISDVDTASYIEGAQAEIKSVENLVAPTGKVFVGWRSSSDNKIYYAGNLLVMPPKNVTLTAQWADIAATTEITYDYNGGTDGSATSNTISQIKNNEKITIAAIGQKVKKAGYHFSHWNTASNDSGTKFNVGDLAQIDTLGTGNNILYAIWDKDATISYVSTGNGTVTLGSETLAPDAAEAAGSSAQPNTGYKFVSWSTDPQGVNKISGANATFVPVKPETGWADVTYYANFEKLDNLKYTIKYYKDSISEANYLDQVAGTAEFESSITVDKTKFAPEGYATPGTASKDSIKITTDSDANTATVVYSKASFGYTVKYYKDSALEDNYLDQVADTAEFGSSVTVDKTKFAPEGYATPGTASKDSIKITTDSDANTATVVYSKASFGYTVKYYKDSVSEDNYLDQVADTAEFGSNVTVDKTKFAPEGYTIPGTASEDSIKITADSDTNVATVFYTKRTNLSYTVNYYLQGTTTKLTDSKTVDNQTFGTSVTEKAIDITGYVKAEPAEQTITIAVKDNVINFYYTKYVPPFVPSPSMSTVKTITNKPANGTGFAAGEKVDFSIAVTNTGNVDLTNVKVTDALTGLDTTIPVVVVGKTETVTTSYTVTQADIDSKDTLTNVAKVAPSNTGVTPQNPSVIVPLAKQTASISSVKKITNTPANGVAFAAGETVEFAIIVTNTGNTTLTNVVVTDALTGLNTTIATIPVGQSVTVTTSYTVTQADVDSKAVLMNIATVTPSDPDVPPQNPPVIIPIVTPTASISSVKTITSTPANGTAYAAGETVTFAITVTNTGNTTLKNVAVTDPMTGLDTVIAEIPVGQSVTVTTSYTVTQADVDSGASLTNVATVTPSDHTAAPQNPEAVIPLVTPAAAVITPTVTSTVTTTSSNAGDVKTGDTSNPALYILLLLAAVGAMAAAMKKKELRK
jgi:uncharacterized repeat protein (TIGR01451 family)/uncharacterized repeat protein (TIGR02543 family)